MRTHIFLLFFLPISAAAQQLTLQQAIDTALKNNFDIQIARNNTDINNANNGFGMAGGLPLVNATASDNQTFNTIHQEQNTGVVTDKSNVGGNTLAAGLTASLTLFNGFKVLATKERLELLEQQGLLLLNNQVQNTIAAVMVKYFDIVRQQSYLHILDASKAVSRQKLDIVQQRYNVGMANDADLMQAQIDLNTADQTISSQQLVIDQSITDLATLVNLKQQQALAISDTIVADTTLKQDTILNYLDKNPQLLSADQQVKINEQIVREMAAQRYPSVRVNTGYNVSYAKSDAGQMLVNQSYGPFVGATVAIPIFNGNIYRTQQRVASYNVLNATLQKESLKTSLKASAAKTYLSYQNTLQRLGSQQKNYDISSKLVNLVLQKFQLGQATSLDVKTAQSSFENTAYQLVNLQYAAKISEVELKRLMFILGK